MNIKIYERSSLLCLFALLFAISATVAGGRGMDRPPGGDPVPADAWLAYDDGSSIYLSNGVDSGTLAEAMKNGPYYSYPTWSPDGREVAFVKRDESGHILVATPADGSGSLRVITTMPGAPGRPDWSKGDTLTGTEMILFSADNPELPDTNDVYAVSPDGSVMYLLTNDECWWHSPVWAPDGMRFVATRFCPGGQPFSLVVCDLAVVGGEPVIVGTTPMSEIPGGPFEGHAFGYLDWSHDGEWIVAKDLSSDCIVRINANDPYDVVELFLCQSDPATYNKPRFSPDDQRIILDLDNGRQRLYSFDAIDGSDLLPYVRTKHNQYSVAVRPAP